ncbi:MAG: sugar-phosphate isomerase, RpiB/LacA/LacB family [Acidobacteria bacterium]|jgi:ribose 5-phosphate isomerase B|nr:sugar-phosphate isomerase, RpiB/LacA/LacB family [Acidobacteriota bacterium]
MRIVLASDHAGYDLKEKVKEYLRSLGVETQDLGAFSASQSVDYPDFAAAAAARVSDGAADRAILVCATGAGMCITANKVPGIRAVAGWEPEIVRLSRAHNDANVLCLPGRFMEARTAQELVKIWLATAFDGGRHQRRVDKISALEQRDPNQ